MSIIKTFISKSISLSFGNKWMSALCADIFEAARTISYIKTVGNKADTLHKYIKHSDMSFIQRTYEILQRQFLNRHFKNKRVELAIDGKKDLYYGKNGKLNTRGIKPEHGADEAWEYIVISVVYPIRIPLMAIPYKMGCSLAEISIELLRYAQSLPLNISKILFDRGFT